MEDHGRPSAKPPWTKTTNLPTAMPQESQHESSNSKHQQDINTSKTNNTSSDQKQQQNHSQEKPNPAYIREPSRSSKSNDTDAHGVGSMGRLFLAALLRPHVVQQ
eukprot:12682463-Ditylum_brightwellii.AAC.1